MSLAESENKILSDDEPFVAVSEPSKEGSSVEAKSWDEFVTRPLGTGIFESNP